MDQDDDADEDGAVAATGDERTLRSKRLDAQGGSFVVATITQPETTQPDDYVPQQLESGASKLDDICPELYEAVRMTLKLVAL